jgi:hypothetical protein
MPGGKVTEEIRDFLVWECGRFGGSTSFGVVGLPAAVLTSAAAFFFGFPVAGLGAAVCLGSSFSVMVVFFVAVCIGCSGASVCG